MMQREADLKMEIAARDSVQNAAMQQEQHEVSLQQQSEKDDD
jgi:hypothetical protein